MTTRRAILQGLAALPVAAVPAIMPDRADADAPDLVFAAIEKHRLAEAAFEEADVQLDAFPLRMDVAWRRRTVEVLGFTAHSHAEIDRGQALARQLHDMYSAMSDVSVKPWDGCQAEIDAAHAEMTAKDEAERIRAELVRQDPEWRRLSAAHDAAVDAEIAARENLFATVPTTVAGAAAFGEYIVELTWDEQPAEQARTALASIAEACRNLLPAVSGGAA